MDNHSNKAFRQTYVCRINHVIDFIKDNIDQELSLDELSKIANFSKYYFHRIFKAITGETLGSYVGRVRIEKSAFCLTHKPHMSVTAIAYDCGFSSPATFSRAFKAQYDLTPSQWRDTPPAENSKISKVLSNTDQQHHNHSYAPNLIKVYIDPLTKQPKWKINMNDSQNIEVTVRLMNKLNIAYVRHHGSYQPDDRQLFQRLFAKLMSWAIPRSLFNPPTTKAMTVYSSGHPDSTKAENLAVDACITIPEGTAGEGKVGIRSIPAGQYAVVALNEATLQECAQAWDTLFNQWLPDSGYQPGEGDYYCSHLNDPEQHPRQLHDVEMYLPVKPLV